MLKDVQNQWLIHTPRKNFFKKFTATRRRHHCRKSERSDKPHSPIKQLRVCRLCPTMNKEEEMSRLRGDRIGVNSSENDLEPSSDAEEKEEEAGRNYLKMIFYS
ncbi:hypothetical protein Q8A73_016666 [Channa argus]|nr:hypothetical protein Q8A73_016666 [Channa argus]